MYWKEALSIQHVNRQSPPKYSFPVLEKADIWYRDDSPVAHLAKLIAERYGIRARRFTSPISGSIFSREELKGNGHLAGPTVILVDIAHQDFTWLSELWEHSRVRLVGILPDVFATINEDTVALWTSLANREALQTRR
jgi:hypothetical protein